MKNLSGLTLKEIEQITDELGATKFRARQIHNWIYLKSVKEIDEMTDLSKKFRDELKTVAQVTNIKIKVKQVSTDGTIKYLLEFPDGECVETVLMRFDNRANLTACVSSQVGCAVNCSFCATGKRGFIRNLTYKEIMGQGEPLLNLDNVLKAMEMFNESFQIGARRLTVSTSGIIPQIKKLADLDMQSTLALSLHASNHEVRKQLMQIENKYPMDELHKALKYYVEKTGRRITIEYLLIKDLNDTITSAKQLAAYLKDIKCNINLIPYNPTAKNDYKRPSNNSIMKFKYLMEHSGKKVTVRLERGGDIDAACGQLSGKVNADKV